MASVVIVTKQCYLLCEAINYIVINEAEDDNKEWKVTYKKAKQKKNPTIALQNEYIRARKPYEIVIDFVPVNGPQQNNNGLSSRRNSNDDSTKVAITVQGLERCVALFQEMVGQIREQMPDQLFVDKLVEKFLNEAAR